MLTEIFGMEWYKVHDEAEQMEHAVSADFESRLQEKLGDGGAACPHGNRVGRDRPQDRRERGWKPLDEIAGEAQAQVTSVFERDRRLLEYLDGLGIRPGAKLRWCRVTTTTRSRCGWRAKPYSWGGPPHRKCGSPSRSRETLEKLRARNRHADLK